MSNQLNLAQICLLRQGAANATSRRVVDKIVRLNFRQRNHAHKNKQAERLQITTPGKDK
jgi:hypothetical protein